jgi:hypothetical protein
MGCNGPAASETRGDDATLLMGCGKATGGVRGNRNGCGDPSGKFARRQHGRLTCANGRGGARHDSTAARPAPWGPVPPINSPLRSPPGFLDRGRARQGTRKTTALSVSKEARWRGLGPPRGPASATDPKVEAHAYLACLGLPGLPWGAPFGSAAAPMGSHQGKSGDREGSRKVPGRRGRGG